MSLKSGNEIPVICLFIKWKCIYIYWNLGLEGAVHLMLVLWIRWPSSLQEQLFLNLGGASNVSGRN